MAAFLLTKAKAYNLASVTSVQLLSHTSAELTVEGKPVLIISKSRMTIEGVARAIADAVRAGEVVHEDLLAEAAVHYSDPGAAASW